MTVEKPRSEKWPFTGEIPIQGGNKSWVNRRFSLMERLCNEAREGLQLGLITPTQARHLTRLPRGNQNVALQSATHAALTSRELSGMVNLLLASGTQQQTLFVLEKPRKAIAQSQDHHIHQWISKHSGILAEWLLLSCMTT